METRRDPNEMELEGMIRKALKEEPPSLVPRAESRDALHAAMVSSGRSAGARKRSWLGDLLSYRIPLYQPAAALGLLLVIAGVYLMGREEGMRDRIVYLPTPAAGVQEPVVQIDTEAIVQRVVDSLKEEFARSAESSPVRAVSAQRLEKRPRRRGVDSALRASDGRKNGPRSATTAEDNRFVGLGNMPQLDRQRRGKSIAEDSTIDRFRSRVALGGL